MNLELLAKSYFQRLLDYTNKYEKIVAQEKSEVALENPIDSFITVDQIWNDGYAVLQTNEFFAVSIVGPQGSGKSTLASEFIPYAIENDFKIIYAIPDDYLNHVNAWLDKCTEDPRAKNFLIMEDMSYSNDIQSRKNQAALKNAVARFRHIFKGQMFVIFITHRLHGTPPMMRNSNTWIFSSMQSADRDDAQEIIGRNKTLRERLEALYTFIARVSIEGARDGIIKFTLKDREHVFRWGRKGDSGDGRLMASYHAGELKVFLSKVVQYIDLEKYRCIPVIPIEEKPARRKKKEE